MNDKLPREISEPNLLIVEGTNDKEFVNALIQSIGGQRYMIVELQGKNNLSDVLPKISKVSGFGNIRNLAIILDADDSPVRTFQSAKNSLRKAGLPVPSTVGEVFTKLKPNVGVFLFPDCQSNGTVEDLIIKTINKAVLDCIEAYHVCITEKAENTNFKISSKSKLYRYLAIQKEPSRSLDLAVKRKHIDLQSPEFDRIKESLRKITSL
ncbi:MAG: DUF3226 domain-containing protein [Fervidobacterium sp.]|uniref:DUF3226 domain-containing protein n=1 Tax=Fervidobacterium TaxID=2422 RepID=UPI0030999544